MAAPAGKGPSGPFLYADIDFGVVEQAELDHAMTHASPATKRQIKQLLYKVLVRGDTVQLTDDFGTITQYVGNTDQQTAVLKSIDARLKRLETWLPFGAKN